MKEKNQLKFKKKFSQFYKVFEQTKYIEKDGKSLVITDGIFLLNGNQQLHIEEVDQQHSGRYSCVAENVPGRAEKDIVVSLLTAPVMIESNKIVEVNKNETQTLICNVESDEDQSITYTWAKNGHPIIPSSNIQMLHLMKTQVSDSGVYECLAENEAGEATAYFNLMVLASPVINGPSFRTMEAISNQTVYIECDVFGIPMPEIDWFLDGQKVFTSQNTMEILRNGTTLQITAIDTDKHEGRYTCSAKNKVGKAEADIFLQIIEIPLIKIVNNELKVVQGREQRLECFVTGIPIPNVEWRRNNELINGSRINIGKESQIVSNNDSFSNIVIPNSFIHYLHIRNVQVEDTGRYTCKAGNRAGETRKNIQLNVLVGPSISDGQRLLKSAEGENLTLDCLAKGNPNPEIIWRKENTIISPQPSIKNRLVLTNLTSAENSRYICEASNEAGTASAEFVVEVLIRPKMRNYTSELRIVEEQQTKLECKADGNPEPSIKWMRAGRAITDMSNYILSPRGDVLMILKTKRADAGAYSCIVKNSAGEIEAPFSVLVLTKPHIEQTIDQNPRIIINNSVVMDCPVLGYPAPKIVWLKNGELLEEETNLSLESPNNLKIQNVHSLNAGRYTCQATNEVGQLNTEFQLEVLGTFFF